MDIALVSSAIGKMNSLSYKKYVYPTVKNYCEKHDFDFVHYDEKLDKLDRDPHWQKILVMEKNLDEYDWLIWIDADIMIMNHRINLRNYIPSNYKMQVYNIFDNDRKKRFNSGFFFLKGKDEWSKTYLRDVYSGDHYYVENHNEDYFDQSAMVEVMNKKNHYDKIKIDKGKLHKLWPLNFPDLEDFLLKENVRENENFKYKLNNNKYFTIGDFCVHVWFRSMEERSKAYELLYDNVIWN